MGEAAKYLFDRNFETPAPDAEPPEVLLERRLRQEFEQVLAAARQTEYARGREDGAREAHQSLEANTGQAVAQLVEQAGSILAKLDQECRAVKAEAMQLALTAADRLAGELVRREPTALLEAMFSDCLQHLGDAPHIAICVHDTLAERLQGKVQEIAARQGFAGKVIVLGDPETQSGDCRIEWADGGITRDFEKLRLEVNEIVKRHLGPPAGTEAVAPAPAPVEVDDLPESGNGRLPAGNQADPAAHTIGSGDTG